MALLPVAHKPATGGAREFDGTLESFLDIIAGRPLNGAQVVCDFDPDSGVLTGVRIVGGGFGSVSLTRSDWIVFPTNPAEVPITLPADVAARDWAPV